MTTTSSWRLRTASCCAATARPASSCLQVSRCSRWPAAPRCGSPPKSTKKISPASPSARPSDAQRRPSETPLRRPGGGDHSQGRPGITQLPRTHPPDRPSGHRCRADAKRHDDGRQLDHLAPGGRTAGAHPRAPGRSRMAADARPAEAASVVRGAVGADRTEIVSGSRTARRWSCSPPTRCAKGSAHAASPQRTRLPRLRWPVGDTWRSPSTSRWRT